MGPAFSATFDDSWSAEVTLTLGGPGDYFGACREFGGFPLRSSFGARLYAAGLCSGGEDRAAVRRAARAWRRRWDAGPLRIRVCAVQHRIGHDPLIDSVEVYGWRAALVAARALRAEVSDDRCYRRAYARAEDARLMDLVREEEPALD